VPPLRPGPDERPDAELVAAAQAGDRAALEALLRRHHDRVRAVAGRIAGNPADAADASQEALIAIVRGLPKFDGRSAFSTWLYRVTTNACLDELRRRRRRPTPTLNADDGPSEIAVNPADDRVADRLALEAALRRLPEEFRVPVVLRDVADLDYAEIAAVLEIPVGTVKSRIARGRSQLAGGLGNQADPSERPSTATERT
jgi:RNA polymerase sigma-70 factor (ECF subfamily)